MIWSGKSTFQIDFGNHACCVLQVKKGNLPFSVSSAQSSKARVCAHGTGNLHISECVLVLLSYVCVCVFFFKSHFVLSHKEAVAGHKET